VRLEELKRGMLVAGVSSDGAVTLKDVESDGVDTVEVIFKTAGGGLGQRLLFRSDEPNLKVVPSDGGWRFDGDGARFRLAERSVLRWHRASGRSRGQALAPSRPLWLPRAPT
jgi:hypothetical protein